VARANAAVNAAAPFVRAFVADGVRSRAVAEGAPYDLVFANILALPLAKLAGDIAPLVARGGHVVLSGILNGQARCVAASYAARGLRLERRIVLGDWTSVVMTRPAA
jgi:ribosomal protein L11 methyltransferase